jgi:hypothetical protein
MVVNATTQFWEDLPPSSASEGQLITVTAQIHNTGTEEQDFRLSVQIVGIGATIFPIPLEVWSAPEELSPNELYTADVTFRMPSYGVGLTLQAEWYDRTAGPAQWTKVGSTATRNIALAGVTPQFPVQQPTPQQVAPVTMQLPSSWLILALVGGAIVAVVLLGKK